MVVDAVKRSPVVVSGGDPTMSVEKKLLTNIKLDVTQITKSIGRLLAPANDREQQTSKEQRLLGLITPISSSFLLDTPVEDFNSTVNIDDKMQSELISIYHELVNINNQVIKLYRFCNQFLIVVLSS
jgi:hypothetical protein